MSSQHLAGEGIVWHVASSASATEPGDRVTIARWATSNSSYGAHYAIAPDFAPRPKGLDVGVGRPWPDMNSRDLSPRVSPTFMGEAPSSSMFEAHKMPSLGSVRDITGVISQLVAE